MAFDFIYNEYGRCMTDKIFEDIKGTWSGDAYIIPTEELRSITIEEYHDMFPNAINFNRFTNSMNNTADKLSVFSLLGEYHQEILNKVDLQNTITQNNVDIPYEYEVVINIKNYHGEYRLTLDTVPLETKEEIIKSISKGTKAGDLTHVQRYIDGYRAHKDCKKVSAGSIYKLKYDFNLGVISDVNEYKAILHHAGEIRELSRLDGVLIGEIVNDDKDLKTVKDQASKKRDEIDRRKKEKITTNNKEAEKQNIIKKAKNVFKIL